jgi:hypothetical protein
LAKTTQRRARERARTERISCGVSDRNTARPKIVAKQIPSTVRIDASAVRSAGNVDEWRSRASQRSPGKSMGAAFSSSPLRLEDLLEYLGLQLIVALNDICSHLPDHNRWCIRISTRKMREDTRISNS